MSVRGRAFCPSQDPDLVSRHMQSHYRRVAEAQAKVDSSAPKSLLKSIKVKEWARRGSNRRLVSSSSTENSRKVLESEKRKESMSPRLSDTRLISAATSTTNLQRLPGQKPALSTVGVTTVSESAGRSGRLQKEDRSLSVQSGARLDPDGVRYFNLLELSSEIQEQRMGRWQLYHTPTGRLTRFLRERQMRRSAPPGKTKPPWRPSFHSSSPILKSPGVKLQGSLHNHMSINNSDSPNYTAAPHSPENQTQQRRVPQDGSSWWRTGDSMNRTAQNLSELGQSAECIPSQRSPYAESKVYASGSAVTDNRPETTSQNKKQPETTSQKEDPLPFSSNENSSTGIEADSRLCYSKVRQLLTEGVEMKLRAQTVVRRVTETKQNCKERMLECRYLQFESEVTRDVLSRGILSEPALSLLFKMHIDKHKHQLREDELVKRLEVLKRLFFGV